MRGASDLKPILINESDWKIDAINQLVKGGTFSSKSELYRAGALMMIVMDRAKRLLSVDRLDPVLFEKDTKKCLDLVGKNELHDAGLLIDKLAEAMEFRAMISPLLGDQDEESFETVARGLTEYAEKLSKSDKLNEETRKRLIFGLKRDLTAILIFLSRDKDRSSEVAVELGRPLSEDKELKMMLVKYYSNFIGPKLHTIIPERIQDWNVQRNESLWPKFDHTSQVSIRVGPIKR